MIIYQYQFVNKMFVSFQITDIVLFLSLLETIVDYLLYGCTNNTYIIEFSGKHSSDIIMIRQKIKMSKRYESNFGLFYFINVGIVLN
jgi:uncharacterized membrane protein YwaF